LKTCYEYCSDFARCSDMGAATGGPIVAGDIDNTNIPCSFRKFSQTGLGNAFVRNVPDSDTSVLANDSVGAVFSRFRLFTRNDFRREIDGASDGYKVKTDSGPIEKFYEGLR